jgi:NADPH-dependent glutamate synthase beta subunit-like oxidoreductase
MRQIAIVGSGPSGCYLADQLLRLLADSSVDVIERLPVPFGLVRYGVAPDHQGTKAVSRVLDRILSNPRIAFFGNVEVGRDVLLDQLLSWYDAVVLATGASRDRKLGIRGEDLPGVLGSTSLVNWYNSHPESLAPVLKDVSSVVIIGNGNVAIDVARILARAPQDFTGSDLPLEIAKLLSAQPVKDIHIVGRRGPADAKFTEHELAELGALERVQPQVDNHADLSGDTPVLRVLRSFRSQAPRNASLTLHFHFSMTPVAFVGSDHIKAVRFRRAATEYQVPAQLAVTCIGYQANSCCSASPVDGIIPNEQGRIKAGLFVVGWAKRGPSGTIPTNRSEAQQLAQRMAKEVIDSGRRGRQALREHLGSNGKTFVDYSGWKRIDAVEVARANDGRCRLKLRSIEEMLQVAAGR